MMTITLGSHTSATCVRSAIAWGITAGRLGEEGEKGSIGEVGQLAIIVQTCMDMLHIAHVGD